MAGTVKKLQFSEGTDVGAPSDLTLQTSTSVLVSFADDAAYVTSEGAASEGSVYLNTTDEVFRMYLGGAWRNAVPQSDPADATKKFLLDLTGNTTGKSATLDFNVTDNRTYTFPDASATMVGVDTTQTLTNKTFTAPTLNSAVIGDGSLDVSSAGDLAIGASVGANDLTLGGASSTVQVPGSIVVSGDLTVNGTQVILNTTTLEVEDKNIIINNGGDDTSAEDAGITVERASTNGSLIFDSGLTSKWKLGLAGAEVEIADVSSAQTLSSKTISSSPQIDVDNLRLDGNTISSTNANGNIVLDPNGTGIISLSANVEASGSLKSSTSLILEDPGAGTETVTIQAPTLATGYSLTLPDDAPVNGNFLQTDGSGVLSWASALSNPMTTTNDIIVGGASGAATRLAFGTAYQVLTVNSGATAHTYTLLTNNHFSGVAGDRLAGSKVTPAFGSQNISTTGTLASGAHTITGTATGGTADTGADEFVIDHNGSNVGITILSGATGGANLYLGRSGAPFAGYLKYINATSTGELRMGSEEIVRILIGSSTSITANGGAEHFIVQNSANADDDCGITIFSGTTGLGNLYFGDGAASNAAFEGYIQYEHEFNRMNIGTSGATRIRIHSNGGVCLTTALASQGAGTLNATAIYDDGTPISDFVFEKYYLGKALDEEHANYQMKSLEEEIAYTADHLHLSTIVGREEWEKNGKSSLGSLVGQLWQTIETQFLYIKGLHDRLMAVEASLV